ncbi:DUF1398 family protein [Chryseobacterium wanjuense]
MSHYTSYISDNNIDYFDSENQLTATTRGKDNPVRSISELLNLEQFKSRLKLHQQGGTDYATFCTDCAENGIEGWKMDLNKMTCSYFDKTGKEVLVEQVPTL